MKIIIQIILIIFVLANNNATVNAQSFESTPDKLRDSLLIATARELILKFGPDYYRDVFEPVIERTVVSQRRNAFRVVFLYDPEEEQLNADYAADVHLLEDTGRPMLLRFGNGKTIVLRDDWRTIVPEPVPYEEYTIRPIYDVVSVLIPEDIEEQGEQAVKEHVEREVLRFRLRDPVNRDELIRRGFERRNDGEWIRTRPDMPPPHRRVHIQQQRIHIPHDRPDILPDGRPDIERRPPDIERRPPDIERRPE